MTRDDALLTVAVGVPLSVLAVVVDAPLTAEPVLVGVCGCLFLELLLSRRAAAVRRLWARRPVRLAAVCLLAVSAVVAVVVDVRWVLTTLVAGLWAYLCLLVVVAWWRSAAAP